MLEYITDKMSLLPSRSISKTLMASCVLRGRTSLAGSVCLLWIPGETEGDGCIGLMKGWAPTTDIIRFYTSPSKKLVFFSFSPAAQEAPLSGPARRTRWFVSVFIGPLHRLWFTGRFAFEYLMSDWRSLQCKRYLPKPAINCVHCCRLVFVSKRNWQIMTNDFHLTTSSSLFIAALRRMLMSTEPGETQQQLKKKFPIWQSATELKRL